MAKLISLLIDRSHERLLGFGLWFLAFLLTLVAAAGLSAFQIKETMLIESRTAIEPQIRLRENIASTLRAMQLELTAAPCSPEFHSQLQAIAFLPDGLNEFLYAPDGKAQCSVSSDFAPYDLGTPDSYREELDIAVWYDTALDFVGRPGLSGNIIKRGNFAVVVPEQPDPTTSVNWLRLEMVTLTPEGNVRHRGGAFGLYEQMNAPSDLGEAVIFAGWSVFTRVCVPGGATCVIGKGMLGSVVTAQLNTLVFGVIVSAMLALAISGQVHAMLRKVWSFEARFRRHFKAENIICTYQPIMNLTSGTISGCEVLVRWRDVDGSTVFPDQFLPIVSRRQLSRQLTAFVVERAFAELSANVPPHVKLQVNFNIFPRDLDAAWLRQILAPFEGVPDRFAVVVEIVESDEVEIEVAQREIELLRRAGIKTHLDDFGTGYSNIQNLASLALEGVKLDRSFAMSTDGSLMSKMLVNVIEMIHATGHRITVEGVETEDRLRMLKASGQVDFVQGYLISRPLDIARFVGFLSEQALPGQRHVRLVA